MIPPLAGSPCLDFYTPADAAVTLLPASRFTLEQLTEAYNQTRIDYIVPMPMNVARLREYIHTYDVDLDLSGVAMADGEMLGLAMLGVRPGYTWITRLGVLPTTRRRGTGEMLMRYLIGHSCRLGADHIILEVIQHNEPAYRLFLKLGFVEVRELLVVRRPPGPPRVEVPPYLARLLPSATALELLAQRRSIPSWLDEAPSLYKAGYMAGLMVELENGGQGWIVYQNTIFQLGRFVLQTEVGDPFEVGQALLHALYTQHPLLDTKMENLPEDDPHWPAMQSFHFLETFRRVEMRLDL